MAAEQKQISLFSEITNQDRVKNTNYRFSKQESDEIARLSVPPYTWLRARMGRATADDLAKYPQLNSVNQMQKIDLVPDQKGFYSTNPDSIRLEYEKKLVEKELQDLRTSLDKERAGLQGLAQSEYTEKERQRELIELRQKLEKATKKRDKWREKAEALEEEVKSIKSNTNLLNVVTQITPKIAEGLSTRFPAQAEALVNGLGSLASGGAYVPTAVLKEDETQFLEFYRALKENLAPVKLRTVMELLNVLLAYPHMVDTFQSTLRMVLEKQNEQPQQQNNE